MYVCYNKGFKERLTQSVLFTHRLPAALPKLQPDETENYTKLLEAVQICNYHVESSFTIGKYIFLNNFHSFNILNCNRISQESTKIC